MDEEERNRNRCYTALASIFAVFGEESKSVLEPFASLIINYIICGLTHVNVAIATQSLRAVDLVTKFLPLKNSIDEAAKLIKVMISGSVPTSIVQGLIFIDKNTLSSLYL